MASTYVLLNGQPSDATRIVAQLVTVDGDITELFHSGIIGPDVTNVSPQPQVGWTYTVAAGTFAAPATIAPTAAQEANTLLAAGLAITSTGTPSINGTYACDDAQQDTITKLQTYIAKNGVFPGGLSSVQLRLTNGSTVAIPSVALFQEIATAIGDFVAEVDEAELTALAGGSWTAPSASKTIA